MQSPFEHEARRTRPSELDLVYNPSLGAFLIWSCGLGYFKEESKGMPVPLTFLTLPLLLHAQSLELISSTYDSSGLTLFASKLGARQEDLLAVHQRALSLRPLSLSSLSMACASRLMTVDARSGTAFSIGEKKRPKTPDGIHRLGVLSEKLGGWFGRLPIEQVASTLRVAF